jgi:NTP pyrophosphatase (non-canonical NTP hydrolase)
MENIEINEFSTINMARCIGPFNCGQKDNLYWITAMAEELGEIAGAVKKLERGFNERELLKMQEKWKKKHNWEEGSHLEIPDREIFQAQWFIERTKAMGSEAADLFGYLNLFCSKNNIDLFQAVKEKFNQVSVEMNCPEFKI